MAVGTILAVTLPGENPEFIIVPTGTLFALMFILGFVERARRRTEFEREMKRIYEDEWTDRGFRLAGRTALRTVIFGQVPLMFFMAYVPSEPSVVGMGCMTVALGCGVWAAGFLYHTRGSSDE